MIKGLYIELNGQIKELHDIAVILASADISPQERHSNEAKRRDTQRNIVQIQETIGDAEAFAAAVADLVLQMSEIARNSRHRLLAIIDLENAQSRLLRELGDKPN